MDCSYKSVCTYHEDLADIGGSAALNLRENFCQNNNGVNCAFKKLYDEHGKDYSLPINLRPTDMNKAEKIIEREAPCWSFIKCPNSRRVSCPAFLNNKGRLCWAIKATLCKGSIQGDFVDKLDGCKECDYYLSRESLQNSSSIFKIGHAAAAPAMAS